MGELVGMFLGGWVWTAFGRTAAHYAPWDKVTVAGAVAIGMVLALLGLAAHLGVPGDRLAVYLVGHCASVGFWLWRFAVSLRRASTPAS
jgi:hypothetical protein